ncbi:MAG TPA: YdeI/OmpD-associated family protein [Pseudonocardiaceae bacterium]|jgi:hypothetical protein
MNFTTVLQLNGKTATGIRVPDEVVAELGSGKRPSVVVTINGYSYRSTVASMGGVFMLPVNAEVRAAAGVAAGEEVDVRVELDTEPRTVTVPADLAAALAADADLQRAWDALSYTHQREHARAIEDAKAADTRQRRVDKAIAMLRAKKPAR